MVQKTKDQIVLDMQEQVKSLRANIAKIEKPNWRTTASYKETPNSVSQPLHIINDPKILVGILASLNMRKDAHVAAAKELGVENYKFEHDGYAYQDWASDIKLRLDKINIAKEKAKLEMIEQRLSKLESPELKEQRELEELQALLNG